MYFHYLLEASDFLGGVHQVSLFENFLEDKSDLDSWEVRVVNIHHE